jgi:beta-phosphoglucomutase
MQKCPKRRFKAVIFDMDGVITNTMPYHFDAWLEVFSSVGINVSCYDVYKREGQDGLSSIREIFQEYGLRLAPEAARILLREKEELFKSIVKVKFIPGSRSFLRYLDRHGLILALVTGTSRHEAERIIPKDLWKLFRATVTGDEVKNSKPHPEPFLKALKALKLPARDAAVIENAPFGIESAKRAGLFCIALETSLPRKYLRKADVVFRSIEQLKSSQIL